MASYAQDNPSVPDANSLPSLGTTLIATQPQADDPANFTSSDVKSVTSLVADQTSLNQYAAGKVSQLTSQAAENWLKQFGNARITLNTQTESSNALAGSSADLLFGLHNQENRLDYIQLDTHYADTNDLIYNIGLGQRFFMPDKTMLGYNLFYDRNADSGVSRGGVGFEVWRDYLKFSGNGYFAISDWQESAQLEDYDEKAADGYDMQVEGYLPAYAQLGAHLKYEQYFGENVALFDTDSLQNDPKAITFGLSYTPIPLVTFGLDYKKGDESLDDTAISAAFNYSFGIPWSQQISGEYVKARRSLAGSRFDFVTRNNDIVMQYRKQDVIKLSLPTQLSGQTLQQLPLTASVEAKNGLDHIQWDPSSTLIRAGGEVITSTDNLNFTVMLPANAGQYVLRGTAYDTKGNASNVAETRFDVTASGGDAGDGTIQFQPLQTAWSDKPETLSVDVKDATGQPALGQTVNFSIVDCSGNDCVLGKTDVETINADGKAIASTTLTKATESTATVQACIAGTNSCAKQTVTFYAPPQLSGDIELVGKVGIVTTLPGAWIDNTQFAIDFSANGGDGNYVYSSSDESVATVDEKGIVSLKNRLADFTIRVTSLGRTSDDEHSLHIKKGSEMLHVSSEQANYSDNVTSCSAVGQSMGELSDFQRITNLWGNMSTYPIYAKMNEYVWTLSNDAEDVATVYRMRDGATYNNISKTLATEYIGCLEK